MNIIGESIHTPLKGIRNVANDATPDPSYPGKGALGNNTTSERKTPSSLRAIPPNTLLASSFAWSKLYSEVPKTTKTLFELERLVARRMDLLAFVDQQLNSPQAANMNEILGKIESRIRGERRVYHTSSSSGEGNIASNQQSLTPGVTSSDVLSNGSSNYDASACMSMDEDLISHHLCRFAFCFDEKWRNWFMRTEEALLRARLRSLNLPTAAQQMLSLNKVASRPLNEKEIEDPAVIAFMRYSTTKQAQYAGNRGVITDGPVSSSRFFAVPMSLVPKLVKDRKVLCLNGTAIINDEHAQDLIFNIYKRALNTGLYEAFVKRNSLMTKDEDSQPYLVWGMLDAFLARFVSDQSDNLAESKEGSVKPQDIPYEAATHMPLCMRGIDTHLRKEGHVRHTGRFMYGLFLKQIGISMEDAMILFSNLMVTKGGGSKEAFEKSSYGYNVRHNYGKEGKKTSYSSMGCSSIIRQPPMTDRSDCHGCPFRFRDEEMLRRVLRTEQPNPYDQSLPKVRPTQGDIEDIISDSKGEHYTRACYKYFIATHPEAKRDTLFRSPYEYYTVSKEMKKEYEMKPKTEPKSENGETVVSHSESPGGKRPGSRTILRDNNIRSRIE
eukprot:Tbor_TRINITY_DN5304_c0_g2::TRINITY_DN5304_c0_g2_i2::g.5244::m.5244/K02685/PRI2; DNA primase large subunit